MVVQRQILLARKVTVDAGSLLAQLKTVTGFSVGLISRARPDLIDAYRADLWRLLTEGEIRPRHTVLEFAILRRPSTWSAGTAIRVVSRYALADPDNR